MKAKDTKKIGSEKTPRTGTQEAAEVAGPRTFQEVSLAAIAVNPLNPRKNFSGPKYDELLASVRAKGVLVPVLLRPKKAKQGKEYEIIAGERRFRAALEVAKGNGGLEKATIPAIVQDMSDDAAYDCMTIENLQRADLTPLEEARAFKLYLDRKGPDALQDLAERIGINPCYIRRRTAVVGLPENILAAWEKGKITYAHLEQLIRLDEVKMLEWFQKIGSWGMTAKQLKDHLDSETPKLSKALFSRKEAGCEECQKNTDVQRRLFGDEIGSKALCCGPECFSEKQTAWIRGNWEKYKATRGLTTNGFRFTTELEYDQYQHMWSKTTKAKCKKCEHLVSMIRPDGDVGNEVVCIGAKSCFNALYRENSVEAKKAADPNAPRVSWHGEFYREEHFRARIPELVTALSVDDEKVLRIQLLALLETHQGAERVFGQKYDAKNVVKHKWCETVSYSAGECAWAIIETFDAPKLKAILQELSLLIMMDCGATTAPTRRKVAEHLGSDLSKEWRITKEYLDKKTTKEIHAIAEKFGLFKQDKAKTFLYEKMLKKRDRFDLCKKGELVKVILESGLDLAGIVPDEILKA